MSDSKPPREESFSLPLFGLTLLLTLAGLFAALRFLAPATWHQQFLASPALILGAFLLVSLELAFWEYFVHRYVLHTPMFGFLRHPYRQHTHHHNLTRIGRRRTRDGRGILVVENKFPIVEPVQGEASFFPWWTLALYAAVHVPLFALLQYLAPAWPWFLGGFLALANSLALYELLHAMNHWSLDRWEPLLQHPRWGRVWRAIYGFHLRHHAVIDCNENICGFLGLPVADWVLGTFVLPRTIYTDGENWNPNDFVRPRPSWPIRQLDAWARRRVSARRREDPAAAPAETPARPSFPSRSASAS